MRDAITSVTAQRPDEVLLVIDHNERLLERARREFPSVTVIANDGQRGLSGARNAGAGAASGDLLVFLDDDARPRTDWLFEITRAFDDPTVIGVGGVAHPHWETGRPGWLPEEFYWVVGCSYRGLPEGAVAIRNPIGANMAFRREVFERVGGFSDGIGRVGRTPLGCEETELSIRATAELGGRIIQLPSAVVDHLVPGDRARWSYFRRRCWAEGLSKAIVARSVGRDSALASERGYVLRTLPAGVVAGVLARTRGDEAGLARSGAIVAGLLITAAGYARGTVAAATVGAGVQRDETQLDGSEAVAWPAPRE